MTHSLRSGLARAVFLGVVVGFTWWGLRRSGADIMAALGQASVGGVAVGLLLVLGGLLLTGLLWRRVLSGYGHDLPVSSALSVFFVGQLGKYVPGSVWSMGVQASLARAHGVPVRATVGASLVFLALHVASGLVLGAALVPVLDLPTRWLGLVLPGGAVGLVALSSPSIRWLASRVGGARNSFVWRGRDVVVATACMVAVWACYTAALVAVLPHPRWALVAPVAVAFALGYVAGVIVPFAPAGVGAREAVFLLVLTPEVGIGAAAAVAILGRVLHTAGDFVLAGLARAADRHTA